MTEKPRLHLDGQLLVILKDVSKLYGRFAVLRRISTELRAGECYLLLGENGAGKSTLLRVLAGLLTPTVGKVELMQADGQRLKPSEMRGAIGYMSHAAMLYDELSATENLAYFARLYPYGSTLTPEEALSAVGLDPSLPRPVGQYSQGMRQRTSLARVLVSQPKLLLLDEPFSNMDAASAQQMLSLIASLRDQGTTIVLTTHQRALAEPIADMLLTMNAGALVRQEPGPARGRRASGLGGMGA